MRLILILSFVLVGCSSLPTRDCTDTEEATVLESTFGQDEANTEIDRDDFESSNACTLEPI